MGVLEKDKLDASQIVEAEMAREVGIQRFRMSLGCHQRAMAEANCNQLRCISFRGWASETEHERFLKVKEFMMTNFQAARYEAIESYHIEVEDKIKMGDETVVNFYDELDRDAVLDGIQKN